MKTGSKKRTRELKVLAGLPDSRIDLSDAPEAKDWGAAVVGKFYRPIKKPLTIRLDADVVAWIRASGEGYQTRINAYLRQLMQQSRP